MKIPQIHLSTFEGKWQVMYQGLPLCAPTDEESARMVMNSNQARLRDNTIPMILDGDKGAWR